MISESAVGTTARFAKTVSEADVYAFAMTLWAASTKLALDRDVDPRALGLRGDAFHDGISRLAPDELRQLFLALDPDPGERPEARSPST